MCMIGSPACTQSPTFLKISIDLALERRLDLPAVQLDVGRFELGLL